MTRSLDDPLPRLREAVALATFPDGGLLVHLASGDVYQLGETEATVWRAITSRDAMADAIDLVRTALAIPAGEARALVEDTVASAPSPTAPRPPAAYGIASAEATVSLCKHGRPLLTLDWRTATLRLDHRPDPARPDAEEDDVAALIRLFVPKILATWFPLAIHASALELRGRALLFAGVSGAGKTTTARALAAGPGGARLISEDVVLFATVGRAVNGDGDRRGDRDADHRATILDDAEPIVRGFIDEAAAAFSAAPSAALDISRLGTTLVEQRRRTSVHKIVFLDAARRRGGAWSLRDLGRAQALSGLFLNSFLPSAAPAPLRSHLDACRAVVASGTRVQEAAAVPAGLAELEAGSRAQIEMIAS